MKDDFDPMGSRRDAFDFASGASKMLHGIEAAKQTQLLEEQIRLQKEALELEKKKLAQEQEKLELERKRQERGQMRQQVNRQVEQPANMTGQICGKCNGTGWIRKDKCLMCNGKGCPSCGGTGVGKFRCPSCNGSGRRW